MGMYTEFHFNVELKPDTPESVMAILRYMTEGGEEAPPPVPADVPLFSCGRWSHMLRSDSFYFDMIPHSIVAKKSPTVGDWYLSVRCNLKNYDGEIQKFVAWIMPYIHTRGFLGFSRYEECDDPTLIYSDERD